MSMRKKIADRIKLHTTGALWTPEGLADAVLDVLMEPTEGMLKASYGIDEYWSDGPDHAAVFKAAIQAAKEGK